MFTLYLFIFTFYLLLPLSMLFGLWRKKHDSKWHYVLHVLVTGAFISFIFIIGPWDWISYYVRFLLVLLFLLATYSSFRRLKDAKKSPEWTWMIGGLLCLAFFITLNILALSGYFYLDQLVQFKNGRYYIVQADNSASLNNDISIRRTLPNVDLLIEKEMKSDKVSALAVAIIDSGKVVHLSANGFKDLEKQVKATIDTPFHIASISKLVTNLAVFKLVEAGKIDLDADINEYLPFEVKNPYYPNDKITVQELLNHRSGIRDDYEIYDPLWNTTNGDSPHKLADFLQDYLSVNGKLYKKEHFDSSPNYKSYSYSNTGFSLLGLIVENVSGMDYEKFSQENIFKPIGMNNTSWFLKNLDSQQVAKTYAYQDFLGLVFKGHNGYPDYPAGQLRTSISDFATLWTKYLNAESSKFILTSASTNKITPSPETAQDGFYTWEMSSINDNIYYSHGGGDTGVNTKIIMDVKHKNGIIIFANSNLELHNLLITIAKQMWDNNTI